MREHYSRVTKVDQVFVCGVGVEASDVEICATEGFPRLGLVGRLGRRRVGAVGRHGARGVVLEYTQNNR